MTEIRLEHPFRLADGYCDPQGQLHCDGALRLARASDEIAALKDFRVYLRPEYFLVVMLARTIVRLGSLERVDVGVIERLSEQDRQYLERLYRRINGYRQGESAA